ncbi:hypothetical protein KCU91_g1769, partial [Aureobasidium melanogenum]
MASAAGLLSCSNEVLAIVFSNPSLTTIVDIHGLTKRVSDTETAVTRYSNSSSLVDDLTIISDYARILQEQALLAASGDTEELFTTALRVLKHPVTIKVVNDLQYVDSRRVAGLPVMTHYYDGNLSKPITYLPDFEPKMKSSLKLIEKVVAKLSSGDRVSMNGLKLKMSRRSQVKPHTSNPTVDSIMMQLLSGAYSNLTIFHLDLDLDSLRCPVSFGSIEELFKAVPRLQELAFGTSCTGIRPVGMSTLERVTKLFSLKSSFELRVLILQDVPCTLESLELLMERYKKTLESVKLSKITLLGSWRKCLKWMRKELDLEKLHVADPHTINRNNTTSRGVFLPKQQAWRNPTTNSFVGKQSTRDGLDNLIRRTPS